MGFLRPAKKGTLGVTIKNVNIKEQEEINSVMEYIQQCQLDRHVHVT
jgi:hypothetical protein